MSSGNSSALSSGVDGLLGKRTQLAPSRPLSLHTSVPKTRSSNVKMGNPSLKCLLFLLPEKEIYKQKEDLTILSHIAPKTFTHVGREGNHFEIALPHIRTNHNFVH